MINLGFLILSNYMVGLKCQNNSHAVIFELSLGSWAGGNCVNGWRRHCFYAVVTCHPNIPSFTKQELRASCQLGKCTEMNWKEVKGCFWVALLWFWIWSTSTLWYWQLTWAAHFFASTKLHTKQHFRLCQSTGLQWDDFTWTTLYFAIRTILGGSGM